MRKRNRWRREFIGKTEWQTVYPLNDVASHATQFIPLIRGNECRCQYRVDWNNRIVIHDSYDGRETFEKPLSKAIKEKGA